MTRLLPPALRPPRLPLLQPALLPALLTAVLPALLLVPLLVSLAPHSPLAHDEGYYSLQARWINAGGSWLAPLWFGQPLFDRCIGAQWLMALSLRLFGGQAWAAGLPSLLAALVSLGLTGWLAGRLLVAATAPPPARPDPLAGAAAARSAAEQGSALCAGPQTAPQSGMAAGAPIDTPSRGRRLALLAMAVLALTPLWIDHAHLATQDMPLLAVELTGLAGLVASERSGRGGGALLAGLAPGLAFLIKGFMVVLPLLAIAPFLLLERRWLLRRGAFWLGLALGWLPVALWLGLSIQTFGLPVVAGLWTKLLFLSSSDVHAAGPLYYLWNIPANTAPWILAALAGWPLLWRSPLGRPGRLVLLLYPLLLVLLLSGFRTKTPYYGLQLTPWIALAAAVALERWSAARRGLPRRLDGLIALVGGLLLAAAALALWPGSLLQALLTASESLPAAAWLVAAASGLGLSWLLLPAQPTPARRLLALLLGPWLALALLTQAGLFSDRSPALRHALESPPAQTLLRQGAVQAAAAAPLSGEDHARLILLALATPAPADQLLPPTAVPAGRTVWIRRGELGPATAWRIRLQDPALGDWLLAERLPPQAGSPP